MKKLLLSLLLLTSLVKTSESIINYIDNQINLVNENLQVNNFFKIAFRTFDYASYDKLNNIKERIPSYSEQVKYWWQGENDSAIPGLIGKIARTIGFPVKIIVSTFASFRTIFFNTSRTFQDFFIKTERSSLIKMFSALSSYKSQLMKVKKILDIIDPNKPNLINITDIKNAFNDWTERGALSDLEDALFPKEIRIFMPKKITDESITGKLKNVFKKIFGQLDPFELIYKGNIVYNKELIDKLNTNIKSVFKRFEPKLKYDFVEKLSLENKYILFRNLKSRLPNQENGISNFLNQLKLEAYPAISTSKTSENISETSKLLGITQTNQREYKYKENPDTGDQITTTEHFDP